MFLAHIRALLTLQLMGLKARSKHVDGPAISRMSFLIFLGGDKILSLWQTCSHMFVKSIVVVYQTKCILF